MDHLFLIRGKDTHGTAQVQKGFRYRSDSMNCAIQFSCPLLDTSPILNLTYPSGVTKDVSCLQNYAQLFKEPIH